MKFGVGVMLVALGIWLSQNYPDAAQQFLNYTVQAIDWVAGMIKMTLGL